MFDEAWEVFLNRFDEPEAVFEYVCSKNHISSMSLSALQRFVKMFQGVANFSTFHVELLNTVLTHSLSACFLQEQLETVMMIVRRVGVNNICTSSNDDVLSRAIGLVRESSNKDTRKRSYKENTVIQKYTTTKKRRAHENVDVYLDEEVVPSWKEREETSQCASQQVAHW